MEQRQAISSRNEQGVEPSSTDGGCEVSAALTENRDSRGKRETMYEEPLLTPLPVRLGSCLTSCKAR
jgi:hypothetical protein